MEMPAQYAFQDNNIINSEYKSLPYFYFSWYAKAKLCFERESERKAKGQTKSGNRQTRQSRVQEQGGT